MLNMKRTSDFNTYIKFLQFYLPVLCLTSWTVMHICVWFYNPVSSVRSRPCWRSRDNLFPQLFAVTVVLVCVHVRAHACVCV
jgi:hypothetical protein